MRPGQRRKHEAMSQGACLRVPGLTAACTVALHWRLLLQGHHGDNWELQWSTTGVSANLTDLTLEC